jgi:hypothetical protein
MDVVPLQPHRYKDGEWQISCSCVYTGDASWTSQTDVYTTCCHGGKATLAPLYEYELPAVLTELLTAGAQGNAWEFNWAVAFSQMGAAMKSPPEVVHTASAYTARFPRHCTCRDRTAEQFQLRILYNRATKYFVRFEVFTTVIMKNVVFWDMTPCDPC